MIWGLFLLGILVCLTLFTLNRMSGNDKLIRAQVEYQKKLTEQIGKPIIYEQRYFSPQK